MSPEKQFSFALMQKVRLVDAECNATIQYWHESIRRTEWVFAHEIAAIRSANKVIHD